MSIPREGQRPLHLLVSPLRSEDGALPGNAVVAVFLIDPARQTAAPENVLRSLFGLTGAEARLAIRLQQGHSLSETAELNHVSRETLKSQVGAVFSKTGTRCQADLIRLLTRIPGMQS